MSPEQSGPGPYDQDAPENSQQEQYRQLADEIRAAGHAPIDVGPTLAESIRDAHAQAAEATAPQNPEAGTELGELTDRERALIFEAVRMAETAEADVETKSRHLPEWLKTAAKSAGIGAIGSIAIGVGTNYAHSKGVNVLPADNSVGEAWFMLVNAYYTSKAWANRNATNLKSKMGH